MKRKIIALFLCIALVFLYAGCMRTAENTDNAVSLSPMPETTPTSIVTATPTVESTLAPTPTPNPTESAKSTPTKKPAQTSQPTAKPTKKPSATKTPSENLPLKGYVIGIDPGHQAHSNSEQEPIAPGSTETKKKVSSGTQGKWTRVNEYEVNLKVGLRLKELLEEQGATVVMTRETNNVNISNIERAQFFNNNKTDYALRLHCNGSDNEDKHGAFMLVPTENPYLDECNRAAKLLIDAYCKETGAKNLGLTKRSDQTGFNWCERMIINIEMGHMSNKEEDYKLADPDYQEKMAQGLLKGILEYFE